MPEAGMACSMYVILNSVVLLWVRGRQLLQEGGGGVAAIVALDQGSSHWQRYRVCNRA